MPAHAEMASAIEPAPARNLTLITTIASSPVITSDTLQDAKIETSGATLTDASLRASPGSWQ